LSARDQAAAFQKIEEAEGLPDAAQGDMVGADLMGGIEEAVQAAVQEFQFFQDGGLTELVLPELLEVALAGEMLDVAAEGGRAEAEFGGQGAVGHPIHEAEFNHRAGGVVADGTALYHYGAPGQKFPQDTGWISGYQGRGGGARKGGAIGKEQVIAFAIDSFPSEVFKSP